MTSSPAPRPPLSGQRNGAGGHFRDSSGSSASSKMTLAGAVGWVATGVATVWINPTQARRTQRKKALLIGVCSGAQEGATLKGPKEDVPAMESVLLGRYKGYHGNITVMLDTPETPAHLRPTHENIMRELRNFAKDAQPGDEYFFHFAGHADQDINKDGTEEDGLDEIIVTSDGQNIMDDVLHEHLVKPLVPGSSLVAVMDTCHSQSMLGNVFNPPIKHILKLADLAHHKCNRATRRRSQYPRRLRRKAHEKAHELREKSPLSTPKSESSFQPIAPPVQPALKSRTNTMASVHRGMQAGVKGVQAGFSGIDTFCRGTCHRFVNRNQAYILCISACKDSQEINDEVSMTSALVELLWENDSPTLKELMREIRARMLAKHEKEYDLYRERWLSYKQRRFITRKLWKIPPPNPEQRKRLPDPQLSSQSPLFMRDRLKL